MTSHAGHRKKILLVALGGNALIKKDQAGTAQEQFQNLKVPVRQIARLSRHYSIIITHGNGPQVGNLLLQEECCDAVPRMPLEILVAQTQGQIGYMIESTLDSELMKAGSTKKNLVSLISSLHLKEGHFPPGSMGPKVEAAIEFIRNGGERAIITSIEAIEEAVHGNAGTEVVR